MVVGHHQLSAYATWEWSKHRDVHYFGCCKGHSANRLGGENPSDGNVINSPCQAAGTAQARGKRVQLWLVGMTRDKMIKNGVWIHTCLQKANTSVHTKVNHLYAFTLGLNTEEQRELSPQDRLSPLQMPPQHPHESGAGPDGEGALLPPFQGECAGFLSKIKAS